LKYIITLALIGKIIKEELKTSAKEPEDSPVIVWEGFRLPTPQGGENNSPVSFLEAPRGIL